MVRVGFIGCGFIARYHLMQLGLSPVGCEVVGCVDPDPERADSFVAHASRDHPRLGSPRRMRDLRSLVELVDAAFVCTPTATHLEVVREAVAAGIGVFCEKPLGVDLADASEVAGSLSKAPVQMVGLVLRSSPAFLALRELVHSPQAGAVMNVVFRDDQYLPVGGMYDSAWRADAGLSGSGVLLEHSIHDVDILEWLIGPIDTVAARQGSFHGIEGIEDSISAMGTHASGASFTLASVWHEVHDRPSQRRVEVFCENRLVTLEGDIFGPVTVHDDDGVESLADADLVQWLTDREVEAVSAETRFLTTLAEHLDGAATVEHPRPDASDALRAHVLVDAMYRSAREGGVPVAIEPR